MKFAIQINGEIPPITEEVARRESVMQDAEYEFTVETEQIGVIFALLDRLVREHTTVFNYCTRTIK